MVSYSSPVRYRDRGVEKGRALAVGLQFVAVIAKRGLVHRFMNAPTYSQGWRAGGFACQ